MRSSQTTAGFLWQSILRMVLLFVILFELTFLASRFRVRVDLTEDKLFTLTASTQQVLSKLEDRLVIEAYFSPNNTLAITDQPRRKTLVGLLEEYEKLGAGKVTLQIIDPLENKTVRETAERLGITPTPTGMWQGLRIRYGGEKQDVIPLVPFPPPNQPHPTAYYESGFTPAIKRLTVKVRPKIGVLSFRSRPGGRGVSFSQEKRTPPQGYQRLMTAFDKEYDLKHIDISKGQLIPEDIQAALLIRPKLLTDRTMFIFDQFLMRGGKLVVFADTCEIEVRHDRAIRGSVVPYYAANAKYRFIDQLATYGVDVKNQIVGDGVGEQQQTFWDQRQNQQTTQREVHPIRYPFIFEAANRDWKDLVRRMAPLPNGGIDEALAAQYQQQVKPGVDPEHEFTKSLRNIGAPGMFWPCPVDLKTRLPTGVEGSVLLRSSPLSFVARPNIRLDPFEEAREIQVRFQALERWTNSMALRMPKLPTQFPLMVHLKGSFPSYFADKDVPAAPVDTGTGDGKEPDEDWGDDEKGKTGPEPAKKPPQKKVEESKLTQAAAGASLLVVGDATFLRDDFFTGEYQRPSAAYGIPIYGPHDRGMRAPFFLKNLLDWLAQERDLHALQNKAHTDRTMKFLEPNEAAQETLEEYRARLESYSFFVHWGNILMPTVLLMGFGGFIWITRRTRKRAFLSRWSA